ncbi:MAG: hypothetical protein CL678_02560 [Bdellovibrionaceae bacterium]|nr:hypothetical protein [Pseudobdellovibrionaceae bacterium]
MHIKNILFFSFICIQCLAHEPGQMGTDSSGGGGALSASIRKAFERVLTRVETQKEKNPKAAQTIREILDHSSSHKIEFVDTIRHPDGIPLEETQLKHLEAYSWNQNAIEQKYPLTQFVVDQEGQPWKNYAEGITPGDHHFCHELLRAGGFSEDDNYQVCIGQFHLDSQMQINLKTEEQLFNELFPKEGKEWEVVTGWTNCRVSIDHVSPSLKEFVMRTENLPLIQGGYYCNAQAENQVKCEARKLGTPDAHLFCMNPQHKNAITGKSELRIRQKNKIDWFFEVGDGHYSIIEEVPLGTVDKKQEIIANSGVWRKKGTCINGIFYGVLSNSITCKIQSHNKKGIREFTIEPLFTKSDRNFRNSSLNIVGTKSRCTIRKKQLGGKSHLFCEFRKKIKKYQFNLFPPPLHNLASGCEFLGENLKTKEEIICVANEE